MTAPDQGVRLVDHARHELELLGEFDYAPAYAQSILAAIAAYTSFGHSGGSHMHAVQVLNALLEHENLTPLTSDPAEWIDRTQVSNLPAGQTLWQSTRNPKAFSDDHAATYWLVTDLAGERWQTTRYPTIPPGERARFRQDPYAHQPPIGSGLEEPCTRLQQEGL